MLINKIYKKTKPATPFSPESKQMIQDVGNVELFELFETDPKTQLQKNAYHSGVKASSIAHAGHLLKETVANRSFIVYTLDFLSIPEYVI